MQENIFYNRIFEINFNKYFTLKPICMRFIFKKVRSKVKNVIVH